MLSLVFKIRKKFYFSNTRNKTNKQTKKKKKPPHKAEELKEGGGGCSTLYIDLGLFVALNRNSVVDTLWKAYSVHGWDGNIKSQ